jgi:carbonic anhydrase
VRLAPHRPGRRGTEAGVEGRGIAGIDHDRPPQTPEEALQALLDGNRRYVSGETRSVDYGRLGDRIAESQAPFAAIVTCADSRLSVPVIFDLGLGHVLVSRVAGNSVDAGTLGSTEYAVAELGVRLVLILGHSNCGAVKAALAVAEGRASFPRERFGGIGALVDAIVEPVKALPEQSRTLEQAIVANASAQAARMAAAEPIVRPAIDAGRLLVVAAVYDIGSGRVSVI